MSFQRIDGRSQDQLRPYSFERNFIKTAEGSVLVSCGDTKVIVTAKIDPSLPPHLRNVAVPQGWITAEYAMLPGSSQDRVGRERNKAHSRSLEIQRLIGRSLRAMVDLEKMPPVSINIDADVIQADGGTRTAAITGSFVALMDAVAWAKSHGHISKSAKPILDSVAAVSVGVVDGRALCDLAYEEDVRAETDMNVVATGRGLFVEVQGTAEANPFSKEELDSLLEMAIAATQSLSTMQRHALGSNLELA